ncbi:MAG: LytTR family DNA-binding domain-containing protein [Bacteroidota bacterium]
MQKDTLIQPENLLYISTQITVCIDEILFFEGDVNYTWIHFKSRKKKVLARTLSFIQQKIENQNFTRISRKFLVNRKYITETGNNFVVIANKVILPVSRRRRRNFLLYPTTMNVDNILKN